MIDDDDLFAVRPAPAPPPRRKLRVRPALIGPRWPVATLACRCGAREEVKEPCRDRIACFGCKGTGTMQRITPRFLPPRDSGRDASPAERPDQS